MPTVVARFASSLRPSTTASLRCTVSRHAGCAHNARNLSPRRMQRGGSIGGLVVADSSFSSARTVGRTASVRGMSTSGDGGVGDTVDPHDERKADHKHCVELVQGRDLDGYLCGLLMPRSARDAYFAVRAFNVEIASVKDGGGLGRRRPRSEGVSELEFGEMDASLASRLRMQWWRDAVEEMYDSEGEGGDEESGAAAAAAEPSSAGFLSHTYAASRQHNPVVRELGRAVKEAGLTRRFLERTIDAREADLDVGQYETMRELVQYGEDTSASLLYLSLECCGVRNGDADVVASHVGAGIGIVTALRSTAYRCNFGEISIPVELMEKHSVPSQILLNPPDRVNSDLSPEEKRADEALRGAVKEMAYTAGAYLSQARNMQGSVPKDGRPSLLPAVAALNYLKKLEGVGFDLFHQDMLANEGLPSRLGRLGVTFSLGRAWATGVF